MGQLERALSCAVGFGFGLALLACEPAPDSVPAEPEAVLRTIDYDFVVHSFGLSSPDRASRLSSRARGHLTLTAVDEPPLWVGVTSVEQLQLRSGTEVLSTLEPDEWRWLARRTPEGTVDAVWLADDMPPAAQSLTRFLIAQLQASTTDGLEQTTAGPVRAQYHRVVFPLAQASSRTRSSLTTTGEHIHGITMSVGDELGPWLLGSMQLTRAQLSADDELGAVSVLVVHDRVTRALAPDADAALGEQIEALSALPPRPLREQPLSEEVRDSMRREAESWASVRGRLLTSSDAVDPQLVARAAAHLRDDDERVDELASVEATAMIDAALAECGTKPCQRALCDRLTDGDDELQANVLAALTRVAEPAPETVDLIILEVASDGDEVARAALGVVLSHFATVDAAGATARLEHLLADLGEGCTADLELWFRMLGNAGLPVAKPALLACLDDEVPASRRRAAAGALRRVPGVDVSSALVRRAVEDSDGAVRRSCLQALVGREIDDDELGPLLAADLELRSVTELQALLDVVERVAEPGAVVVRLLAELREAENEEVVERATLLTERW